MAMRSAAFLSAIKKGAHFIFQANPGRKILLLVYYSLNESTFTKTILIASNFFHLIPFLQVNQVTISNLRNEKNELSNDH